MADENSEILNELKREVLDYQTRRVNRWLNVIGFVLTVFTIAIPIAGYIGYEHIKEQAQAEVEKGVQSLKQKMEKSNQTAEKHLKLIVQKLKEAENLAERAEQLVGEIGRHWRRSSYLVQQMEARSLADASKKAEQYAQNVLHYFRSLSQGEKIAKEIEQAIDSRKQGNSNEAVKQWQAIIGEISKNKDHKDYAARIQFIIGSLFREQKKLPEAIDAYTKAINLNPQYAEAYNNRGVSKAALRQYEAAFADYDKAINLNPQYAEAYNNRGALRSRLRQYEAAVADYDRAVSLNPQYAEAYNNRGALRSRLRQYEDAVADYTKAIDLNSKYAEAYYGRGRAKIRLRQYEGAVADYTKAIDLNSKYTEAYYGRGRVKVRLRRNDEARKDFEIARDLARKVGPRVLQFFAERRLRKLDKK